MLPLNFFSIIALCVSRIHLPNTLLRKEILNTIPMCIHLHTYLCYCSNVFCFKCANNSGVDTKEGCKQRVRLDLLPCFSCNILGSGCSAPKACLRPLVKVVGWALAVVRRFCKVMAKWPLSVSVFIQDMMLWVFSSMKWTLTVCPRDRTKKKKNTRWSLWSKHSSGMLWEAKTKKLATGLSLKDPWQSGHAGVHRTQGKETVTETGMVFFTWPL